MSIRELLFRKEPQLSSDVDVVPNPIDANAKRERLLAVARIGRRQHPK